MVVLVVKKKMERLMKTKAQAIQALMDAGWSLEEAILVFDNDRRLHSPPPPTFPNPEFSRLPSGVKLPSPYSGGIPSYTVYSSSMGGGEEHSGLGDK